MSNYQKARRKIALIFGEDRCFFCGDTKEIQIDHVENDGKQERAKGGTSATYKIILNLADEEIIRRYQLLCKKCNLSKQGTILGLSFGKQMIKLLEIQNLLLQEIRQNKSILPEKLRRQYELWQKCVERKDRFLANKIQREYS